MWSISAYGGLKITFNDILLFKDYLEKESEINGFNTKGKT